MFNHEERSKYSIINFESSASSKAKKPARKKIKPGSAMLPVRLRMTMEMARVRLAHFARRRIFSLKASKLIFTHFTLPTLSKAAGTKAESNAFVRKFRGNARVVFIKTRKLANATAPHVRANALPVSIGIAAICCIVLMFTTMAGDVTYYEYSYDGKVLGVVKSETEVYQTVSKPEVKRNIDELAGAPVVLDEEKDIAVKKVIKIAPSDISVDDEKEIITNIVTLNEVEVLGRAIAAGGENIGTVGSEDAVDELLDRVKNKWLDGKSPKEYKEISFTEEVTQAAIQTGKWNIESADEIYDRLVETSFAAIGVKTVETVNYEEEYKAKAVYIDEKDRYTDYKRKVTPGAVGLRKVTADAVRVNGALTENIPTSYEVIRAAEPAQVIRGTKKLPKAIGNGTFIRPVKGGSLTSPFGRRWGRMHEGIDINAKYEPVYAASDGIIVYTGNKGDGYGNKIIIDHGDGLETLYGHLSKSFVYAGDKVYKGEHIATSGNTGHSTGAHLHFEVRVNGTPRNPLDYM